MVVALGIVKLGNCILLKTLHNMSLKFELKQKYKFLRNRIFYIYGFLSFVTKFVATLCKNDANQ